MEGTAKKVPPSVELSGGLVSGPDQGSAHLHRTIAGENGGDSSIINRGGVVPSASRAGPSRYEKVCPSSAPARQDRSIINAELTYQDEVERCVQRAEAEEATVQFIMGLAEWRSFWTLTLSDQIVGSGQLSSDQLQWKFRYLLRVLNADLFGKRYTQMVHHSYFAYAMGIEPHPGGHNQLHAHVLSDRSVKYELIHQVWNKVAGFAWIEPVKDLERSVRYVCKYVSKGGEVCYFKPAIYKEPSFKPVWYIGL